MPSHATCHTQTLGDDNRELLFEFAKPLLAGLCPSAPPSVVASLAMSVFTTTVSKAAPLDTGAVLRFLKSGGDAGGAAWDGRSAAVKYLEFLVNKRGDLSPEHHNELMQLYLETIMPMLKTLRRRGKAPGGRADRGSDLAGALARYRRRLRAFLQTSRFYAPEAMLTKLLYEASDDLYEERAILLQRIGQVGGCGWGCVFVCLCVCVCVWGGGGAPPRCW
jgi:hypothetical protein